LGVSEWEQNAEEEYEELFVESDAKDGEGIGVV